MEESERFCYLRISIAGGDPETVVILLHSKQVPTTCQNFETICSSKSTAKKNTTTTEPTYRGTEFHRIVPGFMVQGGDFENFDGTGGFSSFGSTFDDESFQVDHDKEGVVSMANRGKNTNGSQFFITLGKSPHLNGKHVAFGQVVQGMETVRKMAAVETEGTRPVSMQRIVVVDCGIGKGDTIREESSNMESDSMSSREHSRKRRKKHSRKKESRKRRDYDESSSSSSDYEKHRKRRKRPHSEKHSRRKSRRKHHSKERKRKHKERRRDRSPSR